MAAEVRTAYMKFKNELYLALGDPHLQRPPDALDNRAFESTADALAQCNRYYKLFEKFLVDLAAECRPAREELAEKLRVARLADPQLPEPRKFNRRNLCTNPVTTLFPYTESPLVEEPEVLMLRKNTDKQRCKRRVGPWLDCHSFVYAVRNVAAHSDATITLGSGVFKAPMRERVRNKLNELAADPITSVMEPTVRTELSSYGPDMLLLLDLIEHSAGQCFCTPGAKALWTEDGCCFSSESVALTSNTPLWSAVHLWYPRLLRNLALELHKYSQKIYPSAYDWKPVERTARLSYHQRKGRKLGHVEWLRLKEPFRYQVLLCAGACGTLAAGCVLASRNVSPSAAAMSVVTIGQAWLAWRAWAG